jgi:hypothetical protein
MSKNATEGDIVQLQIEIARLKQVLGTLITWMTANANSPLRVDEAERLLKMLSGEESGD